MNLKHFALGLALAAFTVPANSQENTLLWEISGNGLSTPSYLYGTMHLMCSADFRISDKVSSALAKSSGVVLEVDLTDPAEIGVLQRRMRSNRTLSNSLTAEERNKLNTNLQTHIGVTLQQVDSLTPFAVQALMISKAVSCTDLKMYETEFVGMARAQQKPVTKLETMAEQLNAVDSSFTVQELASQVSQAPEYRELFRKMVALYKQENLRELMLVLKDPRFMSATAHEHMLSRRNRNWAEKMPAMMKEKGLFFAVGAAHLGGRDGVIELLKSKGYRVTPVLK